MAKRAESPIWRATTASGETNDFFIKVIADDWAGPGGKVEKILYAKSTLSKTKEGDAEDQLESAEE